MTNVPVFTVAIIIAGGGLFAIADGVVNEQRRRASLRYLCVDRARAVTDEIQEWLSHQ